MKVRVDDVFGTKELRFGSKDQHGVKWFSNKLKRFYGRLASI